MIAANDTVRPTRDDVRNFQDKTQRLIIFAMTFADETPFRGASHRWTATLRGA